MNFFRLPHYMRSMRRVTEEKSSIVRRSALIGVAAAVALFICAIIPSYSSAAAARSVDLTGTVFEQVGLEANIDPRLLYAVALCESAYNPDPSLGTVLPYPWVLRTGSAPFYGDDFFETKKVLIRYLTKSQSVDVGMMQINVKWHAHRVSEPVDLLDPLTNVRVGAEILNELFDRYPNNAIKAIGLYHSGTPEKAARYGKTVWRVYSSLLEKFTGYKNYVIQ